MCIKTNLNFFFNRKFPVMPSAQYLPFPNFCLYVMAPLLKDRSRGVFIVCLPLPSPWFIAMLFTPTICKHVQIFQLSLHIWPKSGGSAKILKKNEFLIPAESTLISFKIGYHLLPESFFFFFFFNLEPTIHTYPSCKTTFNNFLNTKLIWH